MKDEFENLANEADAINVFTEPPISDKEAIESLLEKGILVEKGGDDVGFSDEFDEVYKSEFKNWTRGKSDDEIEEELDIIFSTALASTLKLQGYRRIHQTEFKILYRYLYILFEKGGYI